MAGFWINPEIRTNPKVQALPDDLFKTWVGLMALAAMNPTRGILPAIPDIAILLRLPLEVAKSHLDALYEARFIDIHDGEEMTVHDWEKHQAEGEAASHTDPNA